MSEKIVQLNEEVIKGQLKELVCGSVEETLNELRWGVGAAGRGHYRGAVGQQGISGDHQRVEQKSVCPH